ncbi:hypothetical protein HCB39_29505 [Salinispora arenicola]|nr:hypothetical protein [Salinispora arenicola]
MAAPGVNPTAVVRLLQRGWPGVRAEQTHPPAVPTTSAVAAVAVWPTQPEWLPLVEDAAPPPRRGVDAGAPEDDRLRAVYGGLASAGRTGGALLQVHLCRAPAHRVRLLRRAMTNPQRARRARGTSQAAGLLADGLRALIIGVLDILTPGSPSAKRRTGPTDPYTAELARQARAKFADAAPPARRRTGHRRRPHQGRRCRCGGRCQLRVRAACQRTSPAAGCRRGALAAATVGARVPDEPRLHHRSRRPRRAARRTGRLRPARGGVTPPSRHPRHLPDHRAGDEPPHRPAQAEPRATEDDDLPTVWSTP